MPTHDGEAPALDAAFIHFTSLVPDEAAAIHYLEQVRWPEGARCPRCGSVDVQRGRTRGRRPDWYCPACVARFSVTAGTVLESSKIPIRTWLIAFHLMASAKKGISALQLQRLLDIKQYKSAHFLAMRIRKAIEADPEAPPMKGIIESDETYIGGKRRGRGRGFRANKAAVQVIVQRGTRKMRWGKHQRRVERGAQGRYSRAKSVILHPDAEKVDGRTVGAKLRKYADPSQTHLMTDESPIYLAVGQSFKSHDTVHHKAEDYAHTDPYSGRLVSTNEAEGFNANLKRQILGTHHHTSKKHLPRYLTEFDQKFNTKEWKDGARMLATVKNAEGKRLTLYKSTSGAESLRERFAPGTGRK